MRAAIFRQGQIVVDDAPDPTPRAGQVVIRTLACGICGSDLHAMEHAHDLNDAFRRMKIDRVLDTSSDLIFGHEFCGEIIGYGPGTTRRLPVGTIITSIPNGAGTTAKPGGYGEFILLDEAVLEAVPNGLPASHAALTEPMAVGVHAVAKAGMRDGDVSMVLGCGPVGLAVIAALKQQVASPIVAADFSPKRRSLAKMMGADLVIDPATSSPYEAWQDLAGRAPAEAILFECTGVPGVLQQILENAPWHARIVLCGACLAPESVRQLYATVKELTLIFSSAYTPEEFARTLRLIAEGELDVSPLVTRSVGLAGVAEACASLRNPEQDAKIIIEPWR